MKKEKTMHELAKEFPNKTYRELEKYREEDRQQEAGVCIMAEARKDREGIETNRVKEAQDALANALEINESHQKLNGRLQERLTELEEENKKMHNALNKRMNNMRKSGL